MFSFFAKKLTQYSGHLVDWSNFGVLARSHHHYTAEELVVRASMLLFAGISGYLPAHYNDKEQTGVSDGAVFTTFCILGFVAAHIVELMPTMKKRAALRAEVETIFNDILKMFPNENENEALIRQTAMVYNQVEVDANRNRAVLTLAARKRLLLDFKNKLASLVDEHGFESATNVIAAELHGKNPSSQLRQ